MHQLYRREVADRPGDDPALADWEDLPASLQASNRSHAAALIDKVEAIGFALVERRRPVVVHLTGEEVEVLARLEHRRWARERRNAGWRPGPRNPRALTTPYLVPWSELSEEIREYDRAFVRRIPDVLAGVGLEIVRPPGPAPLPETGDLE